MLLRASRRAFSASPAPAPRVVSVLPSATETLHAIGGGHLLVGRSHEDNFPAESWLERLPVLTGQLTEFTTAAQVDAEVSSAIADGKSLYSLDTDLLAQLAPSVILTQDICSVCAIDLETVERAANRMDPSPQVVSLNPLGLSDVLDDMLVVGRSVGMEEEAQAAVRALEARILKATRAAKRAGAVAALSSSARRPNVAFVEVCACVPRGGAKEAAACRGGRGAGGGQSGPQWDVGFGVAGVKLNPPPH